MSSSQRSLFVTLAAQAISSVGFSVSILAWIWLTLVPPPKPELTEPIAIDKKARRRSAPAALPSAKRRSTTTSLASTEAQSSPVSQRTRKVYFADSPAPSPSRPTNLPRTSTDSSDLSLIASPASEFSPASSSSTLAHPVTSIPPQTLETWRESAVESDSSTSSPRPSLSLSRPFQKACRQRRSSTTSATSEITPPTAGLSSAENKQQSRRASGGIIPPWSFRRVSGSKNVPSPATAAPTPSSTSATPSAQIFARKNTRRVSTPVPRTQPYAFPYYAQPPTDDETYIAYLRNLPQFSSEPLTRSPTSDTEVKDKEKESPVSERGRNRKANDQAQAALGHGRRPTPKRSASEGWTASKDPRP